MPILRPCAGPGCAELIELGGRNRCPRCYRLDNRRRATKQRAAGRTTAHWRRLKAQAKAAVGYPSIYGPRSTGTIGPRPSRTSSCSACPVTGRLMRRVLAVDVHRSSRTLIVRIGGPARSCRRRRWPYLRSPLKASMPAGTS
jgi:hypothetical protein